MRQTETVIQTYARLSDLVRTDEAHASSLLLADHGRFLLGVRPPIYERGRVLLRLTGIGGWAEGVESFPDTALRECVEETGSQVTLRSMDRTLLVHSPDDIETVAFSEDTAPAAIVYRRFGTAAFDPWSETFQTWSPVAVYVGRLHEPVRVQRPQELPLFMWIYPEQMIALADSDEPLEYLLADGAETIGALPFDPDRAIVRLTDSIQALITALGPRAFLFLSDIARMV